jgi:hypothetical protein
MSLTFTQLEEEVQDTLFDAAKNPKILRWKLLEMFLSSSGIDTEKHMEKKWMEFLCAARDEMEEVRISAIQSKQQRALKKAASEEAEPNLPEQAAERDSLKKPGRAYSGDSGLGGSISSQDLTGDVSFLSRKYRLASFR